ncbi:MAG: hypothetical protein RMK35_04515, partial [Aquificaceae bacterium]|nr:hypothetical protein [Aquificaceae bacterium]MDW8434051.1 hypothetical protein [Aquificaceae bacterium]
KNLLCPIRVSSIVHDISNSLLTIHPYSMLHMTITLTHLTNVPALSLKNLLVVIVLSVSSLA